MIRRAAVCGFALFLCALIGRAEAAGWRLEDVFEGQRVAACSIAVGADGIAHLAYLERPSFGLNYARRDPERGWVWEFGNYQYAETEDVSIQIDALGRPRIAYTDPEFSSREIQRLKVAENLEGGWSVDPVTSRLVFATSMGLLKGTEPFIAYSDYWDLQAMHAAWRTDRGWLTQKVTNNPVSATSLAVDDADAVHIAYFDVHERALKYARLTAGRWEFETITPVGPDASGLSRFSIAIDRNGQPVVAHAFDGRVRIAQRVQGAWRVQVVPEDEGASAGHPILQIDARNNLHVVYASLTGQSPDVRYARTRAGVWQLETVDNDAPWGGGLSFVLDRHGAAHIVYIFNPALLSLRYATNRRPIVD